LTGDSGSVPWSHPQRHPKSDPGTDRFSRFLRAADALGWAAVGVDGVVAISTEGDDNTIALLFQVP